jgi:N-acetylglucosaminyldiphosphoundecaprenol N-acetyl-beta-D-mannosaminyltransferase
METQRIEVLGVPVDCVDFPGALSAIEARLDARRKTTVFAVNPEKIIRAQRDPGLRDCLAGAGLLIPDGIGVVVAARWLGIGAMARVPGSELMPALCELAARRGEGVFLYGAGPEINRRAAEVLERRYPGLTVAGRRDGYLPEGEWPRLIADINGSGAVFLFVALGSPRQEFWIARHAPELRTLVCQGVGGTFDVLAGRVRRAPAAFRKIHLEWFYRLAADPKRLPRQTALPRFAWQVLRQRLAGPARPGVGAS